MKSNSFLQTVATLYTLFLSGLLFYGTPLDGNDSFSCLAVVLLTLAGLVFLGLFCAFGKQKTDENAAKSENNTDRRVFEPLKILFLGGGFACCLVLSSSTLSQFSRTPIFSQSFPERRIACAFLFLSLLLCLYLAKGGTGGVSRMATLLLPCFVAVPLVGFFAFRNWKGNLTALLPNGNFSVKMTYFREALQLFGAFFLYTFRVRSKNKRIEYGKATAFATGAFLVTAVAESVKQLLFFGAHGASELACPERTLLATIPYINIGEAYGFVVFFSFALRMTLTLETAFFFFEKLLSLLHPENKKNNRFLKYTVVGAAVLGGTIVLQCFSNTSTAVIAEAGAMLLLFVGTIVGRNLSVRCVRKETVLHNGIKKT